MTIDKDQTEPIETYLWHGIIDATTGILSDGVYSLSGLRLQMHRNPSLLQGADLVYVPYAASLWREDDLILIVSVEQEDYRAIAQSLGCPVREIQEEKKTRAFSVRRASSRTRGRNERIWSRLKANWNTPR